MMSFLTIAKKMFIAPPHLRLLLPRLFSSPSTPNPTFIVNDYLVSTFGIAAATAARISKPICYLKSPRNPDAVRSFLHAQGFSEAEIKTMVTQRPVILCSSPENTLAPNLRALRQINISTDALNQIILSETKALQLNSAVHRINFWKDFVLGQETDLIKLFKRNRGLVRLDTNGVIATKISFLRSNGISTHDIRRLLCTSNRFILSSITRIEDSFKRVKELGFRPDSRMFVLGLQAMAGLTREAFQKKMELFKSFGASEKDFLSAVQKFPTVVRYSKGNLRLKIKFLLGEARCDISYITYRPIILGLSLEKRLRPRHNVLHLLELKGLSDKRIEYPRAIELTENNFVDRYVLPHKETIPELHEVYLTRVTTSSIFG